MISDDTNHDDGSTTESGAEAKVPVAALQAERQRRQALEAKIAKIEADAQAAAAEAAKKRGEYEGLYNEALPKLTAAQERLAAYEAKEAARLERIAARNEARVKALPEAARALVPPLDPDAVADWLDRAEPTLAPTAVAGGLRAKAQGAAPAVKYPPEAMALARQHSRDQSDDGLKGWIERAWLPSAAGKAWQAKSSGGG